MKALFFLLIVTTLISSCSGPQPETKVKNVNPDTLNLLLPKPGKGDTASAQDYKHSIIVTPTGYTITMNGREYNLSDDEEFASFLKTNKKLVNKHKLTIIITPGVSYEQIITMLDIIKQQKVEKYKVISASQDLPHSPM